MLNSSIMYKIVQSTAYRQTLKEKILSTAMHEFENNGIRAVKMDDIASRLSISKRTLYEIYSNKEELLFEGVKKRHAEKNAYLKKLSDSGVSTMDILIELYRIQIEEFGRTNPAFFADMQRYPELLDYFEDMHRQTTDNAIEFFKRGIKEGFFISTVNYQIISRVGCAATQYVMSTYMYNKFSMKEIMRSFVMVFIRGFCTDKGIKVIDKFFEDVCKQEQNNK